VVCVPGFRFGSDAGGGRGGRVCTVTFQDLAELRRSRAGDSPEKTHLCG
jgi:hypothetical protein